MRDNGGKNPAGGPVPPGPESESAGQTPTGPGVDFLIPGLKAGHAEAYSRLHAMMADRLFRVAFRMLGDRQEAEDAVQEAFLELIRAGCPPDEGRSLEAWLHTSVRFTCADQFRKRERRPFSPTDKLPERKKEDEYWLGYDPELERALAALTPNQRLIMHLKHVEGLDGHRIAEIMGTNRGAVYATAARAERRLGRLLARLRPATPSDDDGAGR